MRVASAGGAAKGKAGTQMSAQSFPGSVVHSRPATLIRVLVSYTTALRASSQTFSHVGTRMRLESTS
jgi:hypothetical protein